MSNSLTRFQRVVRAGTFCLAILIHDLDRRQQKMNDISHIFHFLGLKRLY